MIPKEIIDNSEGNTLIGFLHWVFEQQPKTHVDIATAFFNIDAYAMVKDQLTDVPRFRLLLGTPPEIQNNKTLGDILVKELREEIEGYPLTKQSEGNVKDFIDFLKLSHVEVRLFEDFLHGKAYIFDNFIALGSSNFTAAGLTRYGELNTWKQESQVIYTRKEWFEKFWEQSKDFKQQLIEILDASRFGTNQYTPYEVFIKSLYELQKADIEEEEKEKVSSLPGTKVNLAQFQEDAIARIWTRLKKYNGCIVADSVGLGKTWIAKKILEKIGYYERKNILVVCPAQLREMWKSELKKIDVKENILSQEDLAQEDFLEKAKRVVGGRFDTLELIVVDESHNFRNPLSSRWENFFTLINDHIARNGKRPKMLFLTATPINNTPWDLYWQIMLLVVMDRSTFIKENIPDLFKFFKKAEENPSDLNDLLNEISIRRTRDYIVENYPDAYIIIEKPDGTTKEEKIVFPRRVLENVNYKLDTAYQGMYREISDIITNQLKMAYYNIIEYKKSGARTPEEEMAWGRMIAIGGIFRTILLKRLESSVEAFRISLSHHIDFLENLKKYLHQGKILNKQTFTKYLMIADEELDSEELKNVLETFDSSKYDVERLINDIDIDIALFTKILKKAVTIKPSDDAKLNKLKDHLLTLSDGGQIVLFTYYADTLNYIYEEIIKDSRFSSLKIRAVSGSGKTSTSPQQRVKLIEEFSNKKIHILMSTDILSEGQNLQTAKYLINYDLHWNPTRMIQRAGRIDRIGSPYDKIHVYNFFPEEELENLLRLVHILQQKIIDIDTSIGLDQTILGEEIHPKVFGIIRRIHDEDQDIWKELEADMFGGGEKFYQPLKQFLKTQAIGDLNEIPFGIYSGLEKKAIYGIFFYYKYEDDFHFWYLYDVNDNSVITNKTAIVDFIACRPDEKRAIPQFFERIYDINKIILDKIIRDYQEIEVSRKTDPGIKELSQAVNTKFIIKMIQEIELQIQDHLEHYPDDEDIEKVWEHVRRQLETIPETKKRLQILRKIWKEYQNNQDWKMMIKKIETFTLDKETFQREVINPYDPKKLRLVTIDFIS